MARGSRRRSSAPSVVSTIRRWRTTDVCRGLRDREYARHVEIRICDDRGAHGFSWIVDEPATRTSHALAGDGRVWLFDPVDSSRRSSGPGARRACRPSCSCSTATTATARRSPRRSAYRTSSSPDALPDSPFARDPGAAHEALARGCALVAGGADAGRRRGYRHERLLRSAGTRRRRAPSAPALSPTRALGAFTPEHLLVGHGEGLHGSAATNGLRDALADARTGLPRIALRVPTPRARRRAAAAPRMVEPCRQPASAAGRSSAAGRRSPASRAGGLSGSASGAAPNERRAAPRARPVERRPLPRPAAGGADQRLHRLRRHLLAVLGARRARDRLVHQRPAEIVDAGRERRRTPSGPSFTQDAWMFGSAGAGRAARRRAGAAPRRTSARDAPGP